MECSFPCRSSLIALTAQLQTSTYGFQCRADFGAGMRDVGEEDEETERAGGIEGEIVGKRWGLSERRTPLLVSFQTK